LRACALLPLYGIIHSLGIRFSFLFYIYIYTRYIWCVTRYTAFHLFIGRL